ncbi:MAG: EAL domain-containing protein [Oscillospiraceae bacterium]|jgi:diguanylate cyclase (GGDEF)-like protein
MRYSKNKALFSIIIVAAFLLVCVSFCIINLRKTLIDNRTAMLKKLAEQGSFAIQTDILGHLGSAIELSHQDDFSLQTTEKEKVQALSEETKKRNFDSMIYTNLSGLAVANSENQLFIADKPYFKKAANEIAHSSVQLQQSDLQDAVIFAVPVVREIRENSITGVPIASLNDIEKFQLSDNIVTSEANYRCLLQNDGAILSSNFSGGNLEDDLQKMETDFQSGSSSVCTFQISQLPVIAAYASVQEPHGLILLVADDYSHISARTNRILLLSIAFFLILTAALVLATFYFFKWKQFRYESKIRCEEQKKYFTYFDALTNLPNRKGVIKQFDPWVDNCCRDKQDGAMLLLDVDGLQSVNNTFGHDAGDQLLCEAAARLKRFARSQDIVGRIGSDEFAILLHGVDSEGKLEFLINKVMKIFHEPYLINGIVIQLSCSVGAMLIPCNQNSKEEPLQFEDVLGKEEFILSEAKKTRKGSYVLFNEDYKNRIERQLWLERALKFSIEKGELFCCFQPQYDCNSKTITGFETLARWKTTQFGTIPPIQFIPMAEKSGFIKELGRYMIENAFAFAKKLEGRGLTVSFNASPMELLGANYADYIVSRYQYYGLTPNSVAVEITESSLIESFDKVTTKLQILRRHGIQIYLDDFGTGYSSLNYLKNLPIDAVKIDKSFIDEIATDDVEKDIVRMIISLAHRLKLEVIAEGVETEDQMRCVSQAGCHLIQGYLISKPVEKEEALLLLERPDISCSTAEPTSG